MVTLTFYPAINIHCKSGSQGRKRTTHWGMWLLLPVFKRINLMVKNWFVVSLLGLQLLFYTGILGAGIGK